MEKAITLKVRVPSKRDDEWFIYVFWLKFSSSTTVVGDRWYKCEINPHYYVFSIRPFEIPEPEWRLLDGVSSVAVKVEDLQDKLEVNFSPHGDISIPPSVRGIGLGSYIYGRLIGMVKEDLMGESRPIEISELDLSFVDAQDKENFHRRTNFYRRLGFCVEIDEKGNGKAYAKDLFSLGYVPPPNRYEEVSAELEEVVRSIQERFETEEERYRKGIENLLIARMEPLWKKELKALIYLVQELFFTLREFLCYLLLFPAGILRYLWHRWKSRRREF